MVWVGTDANVAQRIHSTAAESKMFFWFCALNCFFGLRCKQDNQDLCQFLFPSSVHHWSRRKGGEVEEKEAILSNWLLYTLELKFSAFGCLRGSIFSNLTRERRDVKFDVNCSKKFKCRVSRSITCDEKIRGKIAGRGQRNLK